MLILIFTKILNLILNISIGYFLNIDTENMYDSCLDILEKS